nr:AAA family ATPase [uncultured Sphaerochaeta sp.]
MDAELSGLIETIWRIKNAKTLPNYINYIQFPFFRNIEQDQRINFNFPFTTFIGQNGSGKSSTLHALYGCPEGKTPYDFWFSTRLDPIAYYSTDGRNLRHSFFYGFVDSNDEELQVMKARIKRENNPDYWETSRPILSAGMNEIADRKRNPPVKKNVIYFDFRSELSAFDKYFYYETPPSNLKARTKQDYLRTQSKKLNNLFLESYELFKSHGTNQNEKLVTLDVNEIKIISEILGKTYTEIKLIRHKLFHNWGYSIKIKTNHHDYSEAFAGSGEMAVIRLVHSLSHASYGSLVLLDEPEVSLHPGAQKKLKYFLLDQIKKNKHQIIISTHSPVLIEDLPKEAIKLFHQKNDTGKFVIKENIFPSEAFYFIGQQINDKIRIFVEDKLAQKILTRTLEKLGPGILNRFDISLIPGGAENINKHYIPVSSNTNSVNDFFILDGDKKFVENLYDISALQEINKNETFLKSRIKEQTNCNIDFFVDGNSEGGNQSQRISMMIKFLDYYKNHVKYFPMPTPEDIIWSEDIVNHKLSQQDYDQNIERINSLDNCKQKIYETAKILFGVENNSESFENMLITEWLKKENENYMTIKNIIESLTATPY